MRTDSLVLACGHDEGNRFIQGNKLHSLGETKSCVCMCVCVCVCVRARSYVSYIPASFVFPVGSKSQATKSICQLILISKESKSWLLDA